MAEGVSINVLIKPTWSIIKDIQEKTMKYMESREKNKDLTEATMMCVTELIENAIKYGIEKPDGRNIEFDLVADEKKIRIMISNGIKSESDLKNVTTHIDSISASSDPAQLYTERLMELMENPKPGVSQLGLYRIAYEGEFKLSYKYESNIMTIIAERNI